MVNWSDAVAVGGGRSGQVDDLSRALRARGHDVVQLDARSFAAWRLRDDVDVIHAHGYQANLAALASLLASRRRRSIAVATLHGWHHGRVRYEMLNATERPLLRAFRAISVPCRAMLTQLPASVRDRSFLVPNGVAPVARPALDERRTSVAWVGRLAR
ncbi:MAG TPA: glycosyltransferase, partial [Solirubrobacteraceae bacterium]